jgi:hypothetical protein
LLDLRVEVEQRKKEMYPVQFHFPSWLKERCDQYIDELEKTVPTPGRMKGKDVTFQKRATYILLLQNHQTVVQPGVKLEEGVKAFRQARSAYIRAVQYGVTIEDDRWHREGVTDAEFQTLYQQFLHWTRHLEDTDIIHFAEKWGMEQVEERAYRQETIRRREELEDTKRANERFHDYQEMVLAVREAILWKMRLFSRKRPLPPSSTTTGGGGGDDGEERKRTRVEEDADAERKRIELAEREREEEEKERRTKAMEESEKRRLSVLAKEREIQERAEEDRRDRERKAEEERARRERDAIEKARMEIHLRNERAAEDLLLRQLKEKMEMMNRICESQIVTYLKTNSDAVRYYEFIRSVLKDNIENVKNVMEFYPGNVDAINLTFYDTSTSVFDACAQHDNILYDRAAFRKAESKKDENAARVVLILWDHFTDALRNTTWVTPVSPPSPPAMEEEEEVPLPPLPPSPPVTEMEEEGRVRNAQEMELYENLLHMMEKMNHICERKIKVYQSINPSAVKYYTRVHHDLLPKMEVWKHAFRSDEPLLPLFHDISSTMFDQLFVNDPTLVYNRDGYRQNTDYVLGTWVNLNKQLESREWVNPTSSRPAAPPPPVFVEDIPPPSDSPTPEEEEEAAREEEEIDRERTPSPPPPSSTVDEKEEEPEFEISQTRSVPALTQEQIENFSNRWSKAADRWEYIINNANRRISDARLDEDEKQRWIKYYDTVHLLKNKYYSTEKTPTEKWSEIGDMERELRQRYREFIGDLHNEFTLRRVVTWPGEDVMNSLSNPEYDLDKLRNLLEDGLKKWNEQGTTHRERAGTMVSGDQFRPIPPVDGAVARETTKGGPTQTQQQHPTVVKTSKKPTVVKKKKE